MVWTTRLDGNNDHVLFSSSFPALTNSGGCDGYIEIAFRVQDVSESFIRLLSDSPTGSGNDRLIIETNGDRVLFRCGAPTDTTWTGVLGAAMQVGDRYVIRVETVYGTDNRRLYVNGVDKGISSQGSGTAVTAFGRYLYIGANANVYSAIDVEYFQFQDNLSATNCFYYDANASGGTGTTIPETSGNTGPTATLTNGATWYEHVDSNTPVAFTGTVPQQSLSTGDALNLNVSSYFSGTETPFTYSSTGTTLPAWATLNTSTGVISGTSEVGTTSGIIITATDNATNTAATNAFDIVVTDPVVEHNVSISSTLPAITSTASLTYTAPPAGTITLSNFANNTGTALTNITGITVNIRSLTDGSIVYRTTTAEVDAASDCIITNQSIITGTQYEVTALKFNGTDYDIGMAILTAT